MTPDKKQNNSRYSKPPNNPKDVFIYKGDIDRPTKAEKIIIAITIILAIFNVFIIYFASVQSTAAIDAVKITRDTSERQLRAYLGVEIKEFGRQPDGRMVISFNIINYGQTPTQVVNIRYNIDILSDPLPAQFRPEYSPLQIPFPPKTIFSQKDSSNVTTVSHKSFPLDGIVRAHGFKSNIRIYAFILVVYKDVFDIERHTFYCAKIIPRSSKTKFGDVSGWMWASVPNYNYFD